MSRLLVIVVATATLTTAAHAEPSASNTHVLSTVAVSPSTYSDASVHVHSSKQRHASPPPRCRLSPDEVAAPETGGQYLLRRHTDDPTVSMTLLHPLSTPAWVTPMAHQLAQLDEDAIDNDAVDITLLLANHVSIELVDVGLEVGSAQDNTVRASTHVRLPRQAIDALAASPVVQVTWTLKGVDYPSSLSRHQGQRWYQQPFACIAAGLPEGTGPQ